MLSKFNRLPSSHISQLMRHGKRAVGKDLTLVYSDGRPGTGNKREPRFAFIVSTKIDKRATARNRIKRLLSESVRLMEPEITKPVDGILIAKRGMTGKTQLEVKNQITDIFTRAGIRKNSI